MINAINNIFNFLYLKYIYLLEKKILINDFSIEKF